MVDGIDKSVHNSGEENSGFINGDVNLIFFSIIGIKNCEFATIYELLITRISAKFKP